MTAFIGALLILLFMCIVAGAGSCTALLLVHLWRWARRTDPYEPAAAEAPCLDAAYADVRRVLGPPVVDGGHVRCGGPCCAEETIEELMADFDWHAAEHLMRRAR